MNSTPEIHGYQFDQRLLVHPLAEIWRGRSFTGMEVVALILSEAGAADEQVRERLGRASRGAALEPGREASPLWAANLSTSRPYAITQLVAGQTGAERLLDPLDGVLGNDEESLAAVRAQLAQYGAAPPEAGGAGTPGGGPAAAGAQAGTTNAAAPPGGIQTDGPADAGTGGMQTGGPGSAGAGRTQAGGPGSAGMGDARASGPAGAGGIQAGGSDSAEAGGVSEGGVGGQSKVAVARAVRRKLGAWVYVVIVLAVLIVFSVTYSIGAAIASAVKDPVNPEAPNALVTPGPLPSPGLLPGLAKVVDAPPYVRTAPSRSLVGETYPANPDVQLVDKASLPFVFGWPRPPRVESLGESRTAIFRQVTTSDANVQRSKLDAKIAAHPCRDLATCLADRPAFEKQWTASFDASAPTTAKDARTWVTEKAGTPYQVTMSHVFQRGGQWWLIGVAVTGAKDQEPPTQQILNDIWWQTQ